MKRLYHEMLATVKTMPFAVRYPDGSAERYGDPGEPTFTLVLKTDKVMRAILVNLDLGFGEGYMYGDIEIEGKLFDLLKMVLQTDLTTAIRSKIYQPLRFLRHLPSHARIFWQYLFQPHTYQSDARYISEPYDLGNDFYRKWLDKDMQYTCGYFHTPDDTLDDAQDQKREHLCRKLRLAPGQTLLDIGCGWGGMLIYAAQHHGISGLGVTLSKEQAKEANERIARLGLGDRISVRHAHYRDLEQHAERYDRVVSVGCLEHVGKSQNRRFFDVIAKMLKPDGTLVLHTIGKREPAFSFAFGNKYIFPGVYTLTLHEICGHLQRLRFRIHDVENLRIHYSHTARRWLDGFMAHREEFAKQYGEPFVRMFELYLTNGTAYMLWGEDELYQVVATPGIDNTRPLTRDFLTQTEAPAPYVPPARREGAARAGAAKPAATRARARQPAGAGSASAAGRARRGGRRRKP